MRKLTRIAVILRQYKKDAVDYRGGKCVRCGYDRCLGGLTFHHIDRKTKDREVSRKIGHVPLAEVRTELDKCILVCRNCHAEIHYEESYAPEYKPKAKRVCMVKESTVRKVPIPNSPNMVTVSEAARLMGISRVTAYKRLSRNGHVGLSIVNEAVEWIEAGESISAVARRLGISRVTVYKKIRNGLIRFKNQ